MGACKDRWNGADPCKSPANGPQHRVCLPHNSRRIQNIGLVHGEEERIRRPCDEYSVGSGYCPVLPASRTLWYTQGDASSSQMLVEASHCFTREVGRPNMFLCPLKSPIAVITMRKAGSNTIGPWLHAIDGDSRPAVLTDLWFAVDPHEDTADNTRVVADWLFGPEGMGISASSRLGYEEKQSVFQRLQQLFTAEVATSKLLLPPSWCVPCCASASGRLPVVLVRNPFRRLESYFRHKWLGNERKAPFTKWKKFPLWLRMLCDYRQLSENTTWGFFGFRGRPPLGPNDITHTLSLAELVQDPRWSSAAREALETQLFPLRLEVISSDLERLAAVLCNFFGSCRRLPKLPDIVPRGVRSSSGVKPKLERLWRTEALSLVRRMYASDFKRLGYSTDPYISAPVRRPSFWRLIN